jgi:hypothetical protein
LELIGLIVLIIAPVATAIYLGRRIRRSATA